jgi:hypothetical protein
MQRSKKIPSTGSAALTTGRYACSGQAGKSYHEITHKKNLENFEKIFTP